MNITAGTILNNRYRITSVLGQGGMGAVYRAVDENLDISVAVKENLFLTEEYSRQFQREANILASLRHHSLPRVRDYFTLSNVGQYLVMDYIEGEDLRQRIERVNMLSEEEVILIGAHICDALAHLHSRNPQVIHRDIKPGNIKITPEGDVVLVDFGLAKVMHENQATTTGARAMTPGYSPPEQYGTARTDARSDIYSLGATLYAALTGVIPEDSLTRITGKTRLTPIRDLRPKINRKLASTIETALEVDPDDRFQTVEEYKKALLDAGNIAHKFVERNTVTPPPSNGNWQAEEDKSSAMLPAGAAVFPRPSTSRRRRFKVRPVYFSVAFLAILTVFLASYIFQMQRTPAPSLSQAPSVTAFSAVSTPSGPPASASATLSPPKQAVVSTQDPLSSTPVSQIPASLPSPTSTPFGGGSSEIAFSSNRTGTYQIWLMNADGTRQRQLTNMRDGTCQPAWSPDGSQLAFISPCPGRRDTYEGSSIFLMNADGTNQHLLPVTPSLTGDYDPAWSPDGKKIVFTSLRNGRSQIFVYDLTNSLLTILSNSIFPDKQPVWQPSGLQIAFVREAPNGQVWIMDSDGKHPVQFSPSGGINNLWPTWSRDGQYILYNQTSVDVFTPWLIGLRYQDRNSGREFHIPANPDREIGPVAKVDISPDGMWIAYESWIQASNHDIYIMSINGANQIRMTTDPGFDFGPVWRPIVTPP